MALLWMEGFDWASAATYPASAYMMNRHYLDTNFYNSSPDAEIVAEGRHGGSCIEFGTYSQWFRTPQLQAVGDSDRIYIGAAIRVGTTFHNGDEMIGVYRQDARQSMLRCWPDGTGQFYPSGSFFDTTMRPLRWYYIELGIYIHDSAGSYELKVNGETVHSETGLDTREYSWGDSWTTVFFRSMGQGSRIDDIYVCNDVGTVNNTFLGDVRVVNLNPSGDHTTQWTQSGTGDHYEDIDDHPFVASDAEVWDDTDYLEDDTTSNKCLFEYDNLPSQFSSAAIKGVKLTSAVKTTAEQVMTFKDKCLSGATEVAPSTAKIMWSEYHPFHSILETDPNTGSLWTPSNIDAAKFGVEVG